MTPRCLALLPPPRPARCAVGRIGAPRALIALLGFALIGCKQLQTFPAELHVPRSTGTFTVEVYGRVVKRGERGILDDPITWSTETPLVQIQTFSHGRTARLTIPPGVPDAFEIRAAGGGKSQAMRIRVFDGTAEWLQATPGADFPTTVPSAHLTLPAGTGGCAPWHTVAFVYSLAGVARPPECGSSQEVEVHPSFGAKLWNSGWDPAAPDEPVAIRQVTVKAWRLYPPGDAPVPYDAQADRDFMNAALETAAGILWRSAAGVRFELADAVVTREETVVNCEDLMRVVKLDGNHPGGDPTIDIWDPSALNVYLTSGPSSARGAYCLLQPTEPQNVIMLTPLAESTTLAHELGHVGGLVVPWRAPDGTGIGGHVDEIAGFTDDNLMAAYADLSSSGSRVRLSIGQALRLGLDIRSELRTGAPTSVRCDCSPYGNFCGYLSRDLRPLANARGAFEDSPRCEAPKP